MTAVRAATAQIHTLTIDDHQVTPVVFGQLPRAPLINHEGALNGEPWGTVNLHPDQCADDLPHQHVVWQGPASLSRDRIDTPTAADFSPPQASQTLTARVLAWAQDPQADNTRCPLRVTNTLPTRPALAPDARWAHPRTGLPIAGSVTPDVVTLAQAAYKAKEYRRQAANPRPGEWPPPTRPVTSRPAFRMAATIETHDEHRRALAQLSAQHGPSHLRLPALEATLNDLAHAEHSRRERHAEQHQRITALPQLYCTG